MKKPLNLALYLLAAAALAFVLWLSRGLPRFSAEGAFRRVESRQLMEESVFLDAMYTQDVEHHGSHISGESRHHLAAGRTEDTLYLTELIQLGPLWYDDAMDLLVPVPLTEPLTVELEPYDSFRTRVVAYTTLEYARGTAVIRSERQVWEAELEPGKGGLALARFHNAVGESARARLRQHQLDLLGYNYEKQAVPAVTVEVTLYDEAGGILAAAAREFPALAEGGEQP